MVRFRTALPDPSVHRVVGDPAQVNFACADMDERQNLKGDQSEWRTDFGGEKIGSEHAVGMRLDEVAPTGFIFR